MKILLCLVSMLLLSACSSSPMKSSSDGTSYMMAAPTRLSNYAASYTLAPASDIDSRYYDPKFYMDDDKSPYDQAYRNLLNR